MLYHNYNSRDGRRGNSIVEIQGKNLIAQLVVLFDLELVGLWFDPRWGHRDCTSTRGFYRAACGTYLWTRRPSPDRGPEVTHVRDWVADRWTGTYKILNANAYVFHFFLTQALSRSLSLPPL